MSLKYIQQNTTANKGIKYSSAQYPYIYGKQGCIYTSGCGVCTTLMVLLNSTEYSKSVKEWAEHCIKIGARVSSGTDMATVARSLKEDYGFKVTVTGDVGKLKEHLLNGFKAVCHEGGNGLFSSGGHYVLAGGVCRDGRVIVLDPYYYSNKYNTTAARRKAFEYNALTHELYVSFADLDGDAKGSKYYLFEPTKKIKLRHSAKAIKPEVLVKYTARVETGAYSKPNTYAKNLALTLKKGASVMAVKGGAKMFKGKRMSKIKRSGKYYYVRRKDLKRAWGK